MEVKASHNWFFVYSYFVLINFDAACGDYLVILPKNVHIIVKYFLPVSHVLLTWLDSSQTAFQLNLNICSHIFGLFDYLTKHFLQKKLSHLFWYVKIESKL